MLLYFIYNFFVRWQPLHAAQLVPREPSCRLVFVQRQTATFNMTPIAMHRQVKFRVIILHRTKELIHANVRRQFLANLTLQSLLRRFPSLHFATRKLPPVLPFTIPPLRGEDLILLANNCCYHFYLLRIIAATTSICFITLPQRLSSSLLFSFRIHYHPQEIGRTNYLWSLRIVLEIAGNQKGTIDTQGHFVEHPIVLIGHRF